MTGPNSLAPGPSRRPIRSVAGILVGGHSSRMGVPKALMPIDGTTLLERTVAVARAASCHLLLLGQPPFDLPAGLRGLPILLDAPPAVGPIAGLQSLLARLENAPSTVGILLACDMPFIATELLRRLLDAPGDHDAVVPRTSDGRLHPCCALYHPAALPIVRRQVAGRHFAMMDLLSALRVLPLELTAAESRWVENWNAPGDVRERGPGPRDLGE